MENNIITRNCKECFSYIGPQSGLQNNKCCNKYICNYEVASTLSSSNPNISCGASFQSLLNQTTSNYYENNYNTNTQIISTINSNNSENISLQLQSQLLNYGKQRYLPYQPIKNEIIPPSVLQLQRETINTGVPKPINICRPKPPSLSYNFLG